MNITKFELPNSMEFLDTGTLIYSDLSSHFKLYVTEADGTIIKVMFQFVQNKDLVNPSSNASMFDKDTILFNISFNEVLINFGYLQPIRIGTFNSKELFFNFRIDISCKEDSALIHYTWLLGKEVQS